MKKVDVSGKLAIDVQDYKYIVGLVLIHIYVSEFWMV